MPQFPGSRLSRGKGLRSRAKTPKRPHLDRSHAVGDLVDIKLTDRGQWMPVYVESVEADTLTGRRPEGYRDGGKLYTISPGKRHGKVRAIHGRRLDDVQAEITQLREVSRGRCAPPAPDAGDPDDDSGPAALRLVHSGPGVLREVPKVRRKVRSIAYRDFVRGFCCIVSPLHSKRPVEVHHVNKDRGISQKDDDLTGVSLCPQCHQFTTDHPGRLPGYSLEESETLFTAAQVALLIEWHVFLQGLCFGPAAAVQDSCADHAFEEALNLLGEEERSYLREVADAS